jgi:nitroimidazol reductase NimA-like FMN-containing flavoprotein (pyridoxamine 5'-phosphate oxidase superfamily)
LTSYPPLPRTIPTRLRERAEYAADAIHAVLDEALICHLGYLVDGEPVVLPMIHARVGSDLYLHTSTGSRLARNVTRGGVPVCVTVTLVDGLVLARSQFHHSMNYRSVVVRGVADLVTEPGERRDALTAIVEHVLTGRSAGSRPASEGPPNDDAEDLGLPYWAGVIPVSTEFGPASPGPNLLPGVPAPQVGSSRR